MTEHNEQFLTNVPEQEGRVSQADGPAESLQETVPAPVPVADAGQVPVAAAPEAVPGTANGRNGAANRHAEAGRKGGRRFHELIQRGQLYEQEHGLKRGRQRLRQLIEEGKLYEQEHGLSPKGRRTRRSRVSGEQLVRRVFEALVRLSKPSYRPHLLRALQALEEAAK
jgi:hypothetical protein